MGMLPRGQGDQHQTDVDISLSDPPSLGSSGRVPPQAKVGRDFVRAKAAHAASDASLNRDAGMTLAKRERAAQPRPSGQFGYFTPDLPDGTLYIDLHCSGPVGSVAVLSLPASWKLGLPPHNTPRQAHVSPFTQTLPHQSCVPPECRPASGPGRCRRERCPTGPPRSDVPKIVPCTAREPRGSCRWHLPGSENRVAWATPLHRPL